MKYLMLLSLILLAAGCGTMKDKKILDDQGLALILALDRTDQGKLSVTTVIPNLSKDAKEKTQIFNVVVQGVHEAWEQFRKKAGKYIIPGQVKLILFSKESAKQGLSPMLVPLFRDPSISSTVFVGITDGPAQQVVQAKLKDKGMIDEYLFGLVNKEERPAKAGESRFGYTVKTLYTSGLDNTLPVLKLEKDEITVKGLAVMRHGQLAGIIDKTSTPYFYLLKGISYNDILVFAFNPKNKENIASLSFTSNQRALQMTHSNPHKIGMKISVQGQLFEHGGYDVENPEQYDMLKQTITKEIKMNCEKLLKQLQAMNADPIGLGPYYKARLNPKEWSDAWWRTTFPDLTIDVNVELKTLQTGISN
ncbi:Ger(x)C family spore germination protein [Paenibacillus roseipurpureus]|uniref:Ger(X)C family spore germination protein n=1 Tax=Paenibacillus roseopurpureus TaxID=2918901 RepID=A0AA96LTF6_9BACL|nr:Ger(x)C family spore germination protein [Paenibacillus sp. MBLB1832]WNR44365.1 Ger(x)C family spore germination protein [Paenibacillus sp. MBLB1832]